MKVLSFLLDITPILGGIKMLIEALFKKEMTGTILVGNARFMHLVFAIISLLLDLGTFGIGGSLFRALGKGFLERWAVKIGGDVAGKAIAKVAENRLGRMAINSTERRIKKKIETTVGDVKGYRMDNKQRNEIRDKYGVSVRNKNDLKSITEDEEGAKKIKNIKQGLNNLLNPKKKSRKDIIAEQQKRKLNAVNNTQN